MPDKQPSTATAELNAVTGIGSGAWLGRVLVACEYSGAVRDAFARLGWDAWSCDILPSETPGQHFQGDVRDILAEGWDIMVAQPPYSPPKSRASSRRWRRIQP